MCGLRSHGLHRNRIRWSLILWLYWCTTSPISAEMELLTEQSLQFGTFIVGKNSSESGARITIPASGQAPIIQGRLYLLNNGTRGIYFLSGYTPMKDVTIEITVDELIPSNDTNSQQRMDVIQLEYPSSIKTNINGEARFNLGATLLTHPSNQYPAATYTANVLIATHCDSCN